MHAKDLVPALMQRGINLSDTEAWRFKAREWGNKVGGGSRIITTDVMVRYLRMLENVATQQPIADVIGVGGKTIINIFRPGKCAHLRTVCKRPQVSNLL